MTQFPWNAMNHGDPSGSSACWLDPFHILMSSKFPTTYTTMRCDLCLVIGCLLQKRLAHLLPSNFAFFTFFSLLSTLTFISWSVNLACRWTLYEETLAGWQEIPKNASWFTAPASGIFCVLSQVSGKYVRILGCYVIIYTVWFVVKKIAMSPFDINAILLCSFVCVGCFSRWTSVPPCEGKMCQQELVLIRRHCRPWRSDRSP